MDERRTLINMKLPEWKTAKVNIELGLGTPMEHFIYDNEPFEPEDALIWRSQLLAALEYEKHNDEVSGTNETDESQLVLSMGQDD